MSHVDDGKLNALLDGELDAVEAEAVRAHIAGCADCARRLDEAKRFLAGAADLLGTLDLPATVNAPPAPARRVSRTAKEIAVDLDGATQKTPAIRPNLPETAPPAAAGRAPFDFTTLSWAAILVLALGVGYLANEVRHVRAGPAAGQGGRGADYASAPSASPGRADTHATSSGTTQTALKGGASGRATAAHAPAARAAQRPAGAAPKTAAAPAGKRLVAANAPTPRRQTARALQANDLAAAQPAARAEEAAAAPSQGREAAGAPAALAVTGVTAPGGVSSTFRRVALEEAVAHLGGVIRLMDGMHFDAVEVGPGTLVPGADRGRDVVRLIYVDSAGRRLVLDQQRVTLPAAGGVVSLDVGMRAGDVLTTAMPDGGVRVRWIDGTFWLSLTANVPPDELRRLTERVR